MKNKIILLLKVHNDLCATLHHMNDAYEQYKRMVNNPIAYYKMAPIGEYEQDVAAAEQQIAYYDHQYQLQYSVLKQLTEETHAN